VKRLHLARCQLAQRRGGGRGDRIEDPEQRVAESVLVAGDVTESANVKRIVAEAFAALGGIVPVIGTW